MDLGFLSGLLGNGENNTALTMLLPLLLGKNAPLSNASGMGDLLLGFLNKKAPQEGGFPPLFGEKKDDRADPNGLFTMLGNILGAPQKQKSDGKAQTEYPYELQYNRPT